MRHHQGLEAFPCKGKEKPWADAPQDYVGVRCAAGEGVPYGRAHGTLAWRKYTFSAYHLDGAATEEWEHFEEGRTGENGSAHEVVMAESSASGPVEAPKVLRGHAVKPAAVQRAVKLSVDTYCSATAMLKPQVEITHDWRIEDDATQN